VVGAGGSTGMARASSIRDRGVAVLPTFWGKGYASEATTAVLGPGVHDNGTRSGRVRHGRRNLRSVALASGLVCVSSPRRPVATKMTGRALSRSRCFTSHVTTGLAAAPTHDERVISSAGRPPQETLTDGGVSRDPVPPFRGVPVFLTFVSRTLGADSSMTAPARVGRRGWMMVASSPGRATSGRRPGSESATLTGST